MIVLLSGGLDSCVLAAYFVDLGESVVALSFDYGQRHRRELDAAAAVAAALGLPHEVLTLPPFSRLTPSGPAAPEGHYTDAIQRATVTPHRNLVFLAHAAAFAAARGHDTIAYACHGGDHAIYPDCRPAFVHAARKLLEVSDYLPVRVATPFLAHSKTAIVARGAALGAPLHLTWSCYQGEALHCGRCGTCVERREACQRAGVEDPTEYAA